MASRQQTPKPYRSRKIKARWTPGEEQFYKSGGRQRAHTIGGRKRQWETTDEDWETEW